MGNDRTAASMKYERSTQNYDNNGKKQNLAIQKRAFGRQEPFHRSRNQALKDKQEFRMQRQRMEIEEIDLIKTLRRRSSWCVCLTDLYKWR